MAKRAVESTFKYFSYGSNLLRERILINNPSASVFGIGKLKGFSLNFDLPEGSSTNNSWCGSAATILEAAPTSYVYGVIWDVHVDDMKNLDRQESCYHALQVNVEVVSVDVLSSDDTATEQPQPSASTSFPSSASSSAAEADVGEVIQCRTYQMKKGSGQNLPSPHYKRVIVMGARQNKLPEEYITFLESFPDNQVTKTPPAYQKVMDMLKKIHGTDMPDYLSNLTDSKL